MGKEEMDLLVLGTPSPPISPNGNDYEVFLSFRGVDTRKVFADYLYCSLVDAGIHVFRDDDELHIGEELSTHLQEAIKNSKILIPIISENYASSKWCLDELVHMMECKKRLGHRVLPIFYKVEPADVRRQMGSFGEAFHYFRGRFDKMVVEEWKQALREVASLGECEIANGPEGELVKLVVREVLKELKKAVEMDVSKKLVGIDSHVEEVLKLINKSSGATLCVGIYGMGGIGKTTLAKVIYNKLSDSFAHRSFITDIRESCNRYGILYLQHQLISDIHKKKIQFRSSDEGIKYISSRFNNMKVLIILDDVDTTNQLEALAGNPNWFAPGSRIFVTTRDESVLDWDGADWDGADLKYELKEMDEEQSLILFFRHAFRRDCPPSEFLARSHLVVSIMGGVPLAIEVLGSFLRGKPPPVWRETIEKMQNMPHMAVQEKLMISYDALEVAQKHMFLDIACCLIGSDARVASYMWEACAFYPRVGIEVLRSLSFIKIGDNHELRMHDQMRDLGRVIVRAENYGKPHEGSRLWNYEEALEVLERKKGSQKIQAICLEEGNSTWIADQGSLTFTDEHFRNLPNLKLLHMRDVNLAGDFSNLFSRLRWLKWANCPSNFEATYLHAEELVVLDLSGSPISDDWQGWHSMRKAKKLKVLNLTGCHSLERTSYFSAFKRLEILILRDCSKLEEIDPSIGDMENLVSLDLRGCSCLKELPLQMGKLEKLKEILLDQTMIREIPSSIGSLTKLEMLSAKDCKLLVRLPDSIGRLVNLTTLVISKTRIKELPDSIGNLKNLKVVKMKRNPIGKIPDAFWTIEKLEEIEANGKLPFHVNIGNCIYKNQSLRILRLRDAEIYAVPRLPESLIILDLDVLHMTTFPNLSNLINLKELDMRFGPHHDGLVADPIPRWIGNLTKLESLALSFDCETASPTDPISLPPHLKKLRLDSLNLHCLPTLPSSLSSLHLSWCNSLCSMEDLSNLKNLSSLKIAYAAITEIPGLGCLENLRDLHLFSLQHITTLRGLPSSLSSLYLYHCDSLCSVEDLSNLKNLSSLTISGAVITEIPGLGCLENLRDLHLYRLEQGEALRGLPSSLSSLHLYHCDSLCSMEDLSYLKNLSSLKIEDAAITEIPGLGCLENLRDLHLSSLQHIKTLRGLPSSLSSLHLDSWDSLRSMEDLSSLKNLSFLWISEAAITDIPGLGCLENLRDLHLSFLQHIKTLRGLPSSLSSLHLYCWDSLCSMGDLLNLKNLSSLKIEDAAITEIPGLGCLEKLQDLMLSLLHQVEILPDLSNLNKLRNLDVEYCANLGEIQGELPQFLDKLKISSCESLQKLPYLSSSMRLREVCIEKCEKLVEIQGELPQSLEKLKISFCNSLQELPNLSSLKGLREVKIHRCRKLNVEAISSLCSEKSVEFVGEVDESEGEDDEFEFEPKGEDIESESVPEGEDEE